MSAATTSARTERVRLLATELDDAMQALAGEIVSATACLFLDRLARCEGFEPEEIGEAAVGEVIARAGTLRAARFDQLSEAAAFGLRLADLQDKALAQAEAGDPGAVLDWGRELLLVAGVAPFLPGRIEERVGKALLECEDILEANAPVFEGLAELARDRRSHEGPVFSIPVAELLRSFEVVEQLAAVDREPASTSRRDRALLERILASYESRGALEEAEEALRDAARFPDEVIALFARQRRQRSDPPLRFAAQDEVEQADRVLLRRFDEGELFLAATGGSLAIEWWGGGAPKVRAGGEPLSAEEMERGLRWPLSPPAETEPTLQVELELDGEHHRFELPTGAR